MAETYPTLGQIDLTAMITEAAHKALDPEEFAVFDKVVSNTVAVLPEPQTEVQKATTDSYISTLAKGSFDTLLELRRSRDV